MDCEKISLKWQKNKTENLHYLVVGENVLEVIKLVQDILSKESHMFHTLIRSINFHDLDGYKSQESITA